MSQAAILVLEDGSVFAGVSIGAAGLQAGEVVFNTAMTGYQEIMTDPSYAQQIVTFTHPHIGNTGCNRDDEEAQRVWAAGVIVRDVPPQPRNWRSQHALTTWLRHHHVVGIAGVNTRRLTHLLRQQGAQRGAIMAGHVVVETALQAARAYPGLSGLDLAKHVSTQRSYVWEEGSLAPKADAAPAPDRPYRVIAYDYGIKRAILRCLVDHHCQVTVVPATTPIATVLAQQPDGIFFSNGPGDPAPCHYAIDAIRVCLQQKIPCFGICLGHQLLALATGAKTCKMQLGHHGANHPVQELATGKVMITAQNHGFAVDEASLPAYVQVTHRSLFDGTNQGIRLTNAPAFSFQGHPEASPGPQDMTGLFVQFTQLMAGHRSGDGAVNRGLPFAHHEIGY